MAGGNFQIDVIWTSRDGAECTGLNLAPTNPMRPLECLLSAEASFVKYRHFCLITCSALPLLKEMGQKQDKQK